MITPVHLFKIAWILYRRIYRNDKSSVFVRCVYLCPMKHHTGPHQTSGAVRCFSVSSDRFIFVSVFLLVNGKSTRVTPLLACWVARGWPREQ